MVRKLLAILSFQCLLCASFAANYLTFTAEEDEAKFQITGSSNVEYSLDDGATWTAMKALQWVILEHEGDKALLRGENPNGFNQSNTNYYISFSLSGRIAASGSVMSLIDGVGESTVIPNDYCFSCLFYDCDGLTQAPELPATELKRGCYEKMFYSCSDLTQTPELPAEKLAIECYRNMFSECRRLAQSSKLPALVLAPNCYMSMFESCDSLKQAPELPAENMKDGCYDHMFFRCTNLTQAPELPATYLSDACYRSMFQECTSLTQAPKLPATSLSKSCYMNMFCGCTRLTQAPELPATKMYNSCYAGMFIDCISLTQAPALLATDLRDNCYEKMFWGCTNLTQAPELSATKIEDYSCYQLFEDCTSLSRIKVNFTEWNRWGQGTDYWVNHVAPTGTFICPKELPIEYGPSRIPEGWNVEYIGEDNAVEDIDNENNRVWAEDLNLYVCYAGDVEIYDLNGKQIYKGKGNSDSPMCFSMPVHGVYAVKMGGKSSKVEL